MKAALTVVIAVMAVLALRGNITLQIIQALIRRDPRSR
jgi:hypothetical protein